MNASAKDQVLRIFPEASVERRGDSLYVLTGVGRLFGSAITEDLAWDSALPYVKSIAAGGHSQYMDAAPQSAQPAEAGNVNAMSKEKGIPLAFLQAHMDQSLAAIQAATDSRSVDHIEASAAGFIAAFGELGLVLANDLAQQGSRLALDACSRRNKLHSNELCRIEFADQAFVRAIGEITEEIKQGVLPVWIGDFDDLIHVIGHRDSYGGLYNEDIQSKGLTIFHDAQGYQELCELHRTRIHFWLRNRHGAIPGARFRDDFSEMLATFTS